MTSRDPDPANSTNDRGIQSARSSLWNDVLDSIRGRPHDYTSGSINRAIFLLAIPMVLEMFMQSIFAVCDAYFVGRLGPAAIATVGLAESILVFVIAVGIGLSMGTTATVARRVGEKDLAGARKGAVQAILLGLFLAVLLGSLGALFATDLMSLMAAPESVMDVGVGFTTHILGGSGTILMLFLINAAFRGAGEPALALRALTIANLLNIALDPIFIFGLGPIPAMGVKGAAVATNIARGIGVVYQLWVLFGGKGNLRLTWADLRVDLGVMTRLVRISGVGIFQFLVATMSYTGLIRIIALFSAEALAGLTIAIRVVLFVLLPAYGMSNAAATLVGQNLGAGKPDRAEKSVWQTARYNMVFLGAVSIVFLLYGPALVSLFSSDAQVIRHGGVCLRWISASYILLGCGMVLIFSFNGAGDTWTPTWVGLICHWLIKLPLAWILAYSMGLGPTGVFISVPVAESCVAIFGIFLFRRGGWKATKV